MRTGQRLRSVVMATALLMGAACNESSDSDGTDEAADELGLPGSDELSAGLLSVDDMPTGWAEVPDDDDDDLLCDINIADLLDLDVDMLPSAEALFAEDADLGPAFGESIAFVPAGRGADVIPALADAFDECDGDSVDGMEATISELSFPPLGDDSAAYRVRLQDPASERSIDMDGVYVIEDDLVAVFLAIDLFGDATSVLEEFAPVALEQATTALLGD